MESPALPVAPVNDKPRRFKWLRICLSAVFVLLALALCVLWVRSYWRQDQLIITSNKVARHDFEIYSGEGVISAVKAPFVDVFRSLVIHIQLGPDGDSWPHQTQSRLGFYFVHWVVSSRTYWIVQLPYWFLVLISAALAGVPWLPFWSRFQFRYRLRTLFIVTTVIAVLLGLAVWAVR